MLRNAANEERHEQAETLHEATIVTKQGPKGVDRALMLNEPLAYVYFDGAELVLASRTYESVRHVSFLVASEVPELVVSVLGHVERHELRVMQSYLVLPQTHF